MAVPVSTVPAVCAALVAGIRAQVDLAVAQPTTVGVFLGERGREKFTDEIAVGEVQRQTAVLAQVGDGGPGAMDEEYRVTVTVTARLGGDDPASVNTRAWALLAAVEIFVRGDRSCGGRLIDFRPETGATAGPQWERDATGAARGRVVVITQPVYCHAVI